MKTPKIMRNKLRDTSRPDIPRSCNLFTVADIDSEAPLRRDASKEALKFFPIASFVGPKIDIIGTIKPKMRRLETTELTVRPYSPPFFTKMYITSRNASFKMKDKIRLNKHPGIEKLNACANTNT